MSCPLRRKSAPEVALVSLGLGVRCPQIQTLQHRERGRSTVREGGWPSFPGGRRGRVDTARSTAWPRRGRDVGLESAQLESNLNC